MSCVLSFMIPGHTKFSPDRSFGMIKRKYRRTKVDSPTQLMYWVVTLLNLSPTTTGLLQTHFNVLPIIKITT